MRIFRKSRRQKKRAQIAAEPMTSSQVVQTICDSWRNASPPRSEDAQDIVKQKEMMRVLLMISSGNLQIFDAGKKDYTSAVVPEGTPSTERSDGESSAIALPTIAYLSFGGRVKILSSNDEALPMLSSGEPAVFHTRSSTHATNKNNKEISTKGFWKSLWKAIRAQGKDKGMDFALGTSKGHLLVYQNIKTGTMLVGMENDGPMSSLSGMLGHLKRGLASGSSANTVAMKTSAAGVGKLHGKGKGSENLTPLGQQVKADGYPVPSRLYNGMQATVRQDDLKQIDSLLNDPKLRWEDVIQLTPCADIEAMKNSLQAIQAQSLGVSEGPSTPDASKGAKTDRSAKEPPDPSLPAQASLSSPKSRWAVLRKSMRMNRPSDALSTEKLSEQVGGFADKSDLSASLVKTPSGKAVPGSGLS